MTAALNQFFLPRTANLPLQELRRLRLSVGTSMLLSVLSALCLPLVALMLRQLFSVLLVSASVVLMAANVLVSRLTRSTWLPGIVVCLWLLLGVTASALMGSEGYVFQYFAAIPLLSSFLLGPRLGLLFTGMVVLELLAFDGLALGRLPMP